MTEKKQPDLPTLYIFAMFLETAKTLLGLMSVFSTTTIFTLPAVRVRSTCIMIRVSVCLSVYLFVRSHISKTTHRNSSYRRGSILLWRQCYTLCTSGFVDDVIFSLDAANRLESKTTRMFRRVRQVASLGAKTAVSDCIFCAICSTLAVDRSHKNQA